jgi:flagellar biosynthesis regulator FlbT
MEGPVITVNAGEALWIDGRALRFQTAARVQLPFGTRFIRGRDVLEAEADGTPELDAYLAIQAVHLATRANYLPLLAVAQAALAQLRSVEATLAARALALHRTHHALLALRPLVTQDAADDERPALCA